MDVEGEIPWERSDERLDGVVEDSLVEDSLVADSSVEIGVIEDSRVSDGSMEDVSRRATLKLAINVVLKFALSANVDPKDDNPSAEEGLDCDAKPDRTIDCESDDGPTVEVVRVPEMVNGDVEAPALDSCMDEEPGIDVVEPAGLPDDSVIR